MSHLLQDYCIWVSHPKVLCGTCPTSVENTIIEVCPLIIYKPITYPRKTLTLIKMVTVFFFFFFFFFKDLEEFSSWSTMNFRILSDAAQRRLMLWLKAFVQTNRKFHGDSEYVVHFTPSSAVMEYRLFECFSLIHILHMMHVNLTDSIWCGTMTPDRRIKAQ